MSDNWSATIRVKGEEILFISSNSISGIDITAEHEAEIVNIAEHLLSFVGQPYHLLERPNLPNMWDGLEY